MNLKRRTMQLILLLPFIANAQYFKKGTLSVSAGWGFYSNTADKLKQKNLVTKPSSMDADASTSGFPLFLTVNYGLSNSLSVGATIGHLSAKSHTGEGIDSLTNPSAPRMYYYAFRASYTIATVRGDWHWLTSPTGEDYSMDLYSGASVGTYVLNSKFYFDKNSNPGISEAQTNRKLNLNKAGIAWHINAIGYKQKFGSGKWCIYGELGWGCWGLFKAGALYNIRK